MNIPLTGLAVGLAIVVQLAARAALCQEVGHVLQEVLRPTALRGIPKNLSGLTWNHASGTLFAVTNDPAAVFEISTAGKVVRTIRLKGFEDTEGIAYVENTRFAIVEERSGAVSIVDIDARAARVGPDAIARVKLGTGSKPNKGFESLTYDPRTRTLLTMREIEPFICYSIPLDRRYQPGTRGERPLPGLNVEDVASLAVAPDGNLWVLSEASAQIVELAPNGEVLRRYTLDLERERFRPEGMTFAPDGTLYIVGEPNMLAAYRPAEAAISGTNP